MKTRYLILCLAVMAFACQHKPKEGHLSADKPSTEASAQTSSQATEATQASDTATQPVRDPNAPLGTPANPLVIGEDGVIDFSQLNGTQPLTVEERIASHIDSISARAERGDRNYQYYYGQCFEKGVGVTLDYRQAMAWYQKAAEQGLPKAYGAIGGLYRLGQGVKPDPAKAFEWFTKGAEAGDDNAMLCLGNCYYTAYGTTQNFSEAVRWWNAAADQDNGYALSQMGDAYYGGIGVTKDLEQAVSYYQRAVEKGIPFAQYRLGILVYYGKGVEKDPQGNACGVQKVAEEDCLYRNRLTQCKRLCNHAVGFFAPGFSA